MAFDKLEQERPELMSQIRKTVVDVTGTLHSKFGPASRDYFAAKRIVTTQHRLGNLNEGSVLEYARGHRIEEAKVALSLLCRLPVEVVERALADASGELTSILAKSLDFSWDTAMALLFLGAKDHRISASHLADMKDHYSLLKTETSRDVLKLYRVRKCETAAELELHRLPQLHASG